MTILARSGPAAAETKAFPGRSAARSSSRSGALQSRGPACLLNRGPGSAERHEECRTASGTRNLSSLGRYLVERHVLVHSDIAGQTEHAFGDDVAHDLI